MATRSVEGLESLLKSIGADKPIPRSLSADTLRSPIDIYLFYLATALTELTGCDVQNAYDAIQWPNDFGDLVVVIPRLRLKDTDPHDLAVDFQITFPRSPMLQHPFADDKNLRFFFYAGSLARLLLPYILDRSISYGKASTPIMKEAQNDRREHRRVVVEFSSPNLGKEFDGNHLRSTIIGVYIAALYESQGWEVVRINYFGDWGKHIGLLLYGWTIFGCDEQFEADPIRHLVEISTKTHALLTKEQRQAKALREIGQGDEARRIEIEGISGKKDDFFKKLEDRHPETLELWRRFRDASIKKYIEQYSRMNIIFDDFSGESTIETETIAHVESLLTENGLYEKSDDAWIINFSKFEIRGLKKCIARYRNNTTSYLLRDVATAIERYRKYKFDKMIYVATSRQESHFQQVFKTLESIGHDDMTRRLHHFSFTLGKDLGITPKDEARGLLLSDILDQCRNSVDYHLAGSPEDTSEFPRGSIKVSDTLGISTLLVQDLSHRHNTAVTFDINKITTVYGHTGLHLQQWYLALITKVRGTIIDRESLGSADMSIFEHPDSFHTDVLRLLIQFPEQVKMSFRSHESSILLTYLFRLIDALSVIWEDLDGELIDGELNNASSASDTALIALYQCAVYVLENGMTIVGVTPLKMNG